MTLMGLISKHGILIVGVTNEAQHEGMSKLEAIVPIRSRLAHRPVRVAIAVGDLSPLQLGHPTQICVSSGPSRGGESMPTIKKIAQPWLCAYAK